MQTLNTDLNIIQALDDLPNATGGLSAAELKAKFDEAANIIKTYLNTVLIPALTSTTANASGAEQIGIEAVTGLSADNVMDALVEIKNLITSTSIPAKSIDASYLADGAVETAILDDGAVTTAKIDNGAVTKAKTDFSSGLKVGGNTYNITIDGLGRTWLPDPLSSGAGYLYGSTFPTTTAYLTKGRLFFKKVENS